MNKKYILIGAISAIIVVILSGLIFFACRNTEKYKDLESTDGKFKVSIPTSINYTINSKENNDFTIDLYSKQDEMYMYATTISKMRELDLLEVATDDKTEYFKDKENIREDSGIIQTTINNYKACEYNLVYYDKEYGKDFYCNVVWLETENNIYVFNFEVVNDNADKYKDIFTNIKNSFVEL